VKNALPFEWIAASRFLREGRLQTAFIILGVSIGVGVIVFMSAILAGQQANVIRRALTGQPHVVLLPAQEVARPLRAGPELAQAAIVQKPFQRLKSIDQWQRILAEVARMPGVSAVTPIASGNMLAVRGEATRSITLTGIEPEGYYRIIAIPEKLTAGTARLGAEDIILGTDLAIDLGVAVGDKVRIVPSNGQALTLRVVGLVDLGNKGANQRTAYATLHTAQALLSLIGGVTSIDVTVDDIYAAEDVAQAIAAATRVQADSWIRTNAQLYVAISAQMVANTGIRFFVGLAIALGIAAVLVVSVMQKSKEIGILRAMGASQGQILRVFLIEGGVLGLAGSVFGSGLGAAAIVLWGALVKNPDGTPLFPLALEPRLFIGAAVLATATGIVAALAPALRGARLDPVAAIRG
jgi:lipoprotein-releasing system permease protein